MALSSHNFFHFTSEMKFLLQILKEGFWPRYCREYGWGNQYNFAIPMVCFCDIPLTQIFEHASFYGNWGIGVKPAWIHLHKEITPVQYIALGSNEFNLINQLISKLKNGNADDSDIRRLLLAKKVIGNAINKSGKCSKKKFYDEREWRYVPTAIGREHIIIPIKRNNGFDSCSASEHTEKIKLAIKPEFISYIIIPSEYYRKPMIEELRKIYTSKQQTDHLRLLISRIVSLQQIKDDF